MKIADEEIPVIFELAAGGYSRKFIGDRFGVTPQHITAILYGRGGRRRI